MNSETTETNEMTNTTPRTQAAVVGIGAPLATLALILGPVLVGFNDLPDPIATGWAGGGEARTPASPSTFLAIQAAAAIVSAVLFALGGFQRFKVPIINGTAAVVAASMAPTFAVLSISVMGANRGIDDWRQAQDPGLLWLILAITTPFIAIAAVGWLMRSTFLTRSGPVLDPPSAGLPLSETSAAAWHSQATSSWPRLIAIPLLIVSLVTAIVGTFQAGAVGLLLGAVCAVVALSCLAFSSILVSVDRRGLTVRYGPLPWPKSHVALDSIKTASSIDVRPTEHGGWGYRGSRKLFGKAAVVVRGGDGIRVDLTDGTEFVVTVDNATQGAGVLNDLRAAAG